MGMTMGQALAIGAPVSPSPIVLLIVRRVSHDTPAEQSAAEQTETALEYKEMRPNVELIFTDVDFDISGGTPIEQRPGMKEWLEPEKINEWDGIGAPEMARLSRDLRNYLNFVHDMTERGKFFVDLSDGTDSTTEPGRQILEDRIVAADRYRRYVAGKRQRRAERTADNGDWDGGRLPYGYKPVPIEKVDEFGKPRVDWHLFRDIEGDLPQRGTFAVVERMIEMAFDHKSNSAIVRALNADGIKTRLGKEWGETSIDRVLTSPALFGAQVKMVGSLQQVRRDRNGQPVMFVKPGVEDYEQEPIISEDRWHDLQDELKSRSRGRGQSQSRHELWNVAFCAHCSQPCEDDRPCAEHDVMLSGVRRHKHTVKGNHYWCKKCGFMIRLEFLEAYVEWRVLKAAGDKLLQRRKVIRYAAPTAEIVKLERQIEQLRMVLDADPDDENLQQSIKSKEEKLVQLANGRRKPDEVSLVPVEPHITVAEHWQSLTTPKARNDYLRETGTIFYADRDGITGMLGWMESDSPGLTGLRQMMRRLKLPTIETWPEVAEHIDLSLPRNLASTGKDKQP